MTETCIRADNVEANSVGLLIGSRAIGRFIGKPARATDRLIRLGAIPVFKLGGRAAATRDGLRNWIAENSARALAEHEARFAEQRQLPSYLLNDPVHPTQDVQAA